MQNPLAEVFLRIIEDAGREVFNICGNKIRTYVTYDGDIIQLDLYDHRKYMVAIMVAINNHGDLLAGDIKVQYRDDTYQKVSMTDPDVDPESFIKNAAIRISDRFMREIQARPELQW